MAAHLCRCAAICSELWPFVCKYFLFCRVCRVCKEHLIRASMSMMDPNLLADAAQFGGPQSPLDIKPDVGASLLTTVSSGNILCVS